MLQSVTKLEKFKFFFARKFYKSLYLEGFDKFFSVLFCKDINLKAIYRLIYWVISLIIVLIFKIRGRLPLSVKESMLKLKISPHSINITEKLGYIVVDVSGIFDENTSWEIFAYLDQYQKYIGFIRVVIDLSKIKYMAKDSFHSIIALVEEEENNGKEIYFIIGDNLSNKFTEAGLSYLTKKTLSEFFI